ncbi:MAG: dCTP deaminase [Spirochaetota bacterium]
MKTETLQQLVHGIIHEGKQIPESGDGVIATAKRIGRLTHNGTLDFGGSEYSQAGVEWIEPEKKNEDDDYGWWMLDEGDYLVEYNESVTPTSDLRCFIQIWEPAARNGLSQPFQIIKEAREPLTATIHVADSGIGIKENARISFIGVM